MQDALALAVRDVCLSMATHAVQLGVIAAGSVAAFIVTRHYVPRVAGTMLTRHIFGIDINKTTAEERRAFAAERREAGRNNVATTVRESNTHDTFMKYAVPESLGILAGTVYLSIVVVLILVLNVDISVMSGPLISITVMLLLGFVDDVLDVAWRFKLLLSALGAMPLVLVYDGSRSMLIPPALTPFVNRCIQFLSRYVGNSNTNGSSAVSHATTFTLVPWRIMRWLPIPHTTNTAEGTTTSSSVSSLAITFTPRDNYLVLNLGALYLVYLVLICIFCTNSINILAGVNGVEVGQSIVIAVACVAYNLAQLRLERRFTGDKLTDADDLSVQHQLRALLLLGPFIGVSAALWIFNRYPARVFVGDSYTYFAGTVLAVAGITGVYSKTLLLFFMPQLVNFAISLPQLFGLVPCPRHRVPLWDKKRDRLCNSHNLTLLNAILYVCGDLHERTLTQVVLFIQVMCCLLGFGVRYWVSSFMYDRVN